jgi:hypothetical protein
VARKFKTPITIDELGSASSQALAANVDGDSQNRINIDAGGKITWGSGSATGDTTLYRSAADTLKTDDAFTATSLAVTGQFTFPTSDGSADQVITTNGSGTLTWSDVSANATVSDTAPSSPATGQIWYESDTGRTFVYYDSFWVEVGASPPASPFITDLDEDTKIQVEESADEDKIRFDTAGSERMIIDASGNVGIGTTTPAHPLHVTGSDNRPIRAESSVSGSYIDIQDSATTGEGYVAIGAVGDEARIISGGTTRVTVDSSGNVGIGTTSPSQELDVNGDIVVPVGNGIMFDRVGSDLHILYKETPSSSTYGSPDDVVLRNPNGARLRFQTNGTNDRMTIDSSGNVGIGTTSPSTLLHVGDDTVSDNIVTVTAANNTSAGVDLMGDLSGAKGFRVKYEGNGNYFAVEDNTSGVQTERMRITASGNVGIGTTTPGTLLNVGGTTNPGTNGELYVESNIIPVNLYYTGTNAGYSGWKLYSNVTGTEVLQALVRANGDFESRTNTYGAISDIATKQDVVDAPSQWDDIKAVQLRKYRLIDDVAANGEDALVQLGVVAQELEAVGLGGLVVDADPDNDKPYKSVKYSVLLLKALGALQEAMARIEALEAN